MLESFEAKSVNARIAGGASWIGCCDSGSVGIVRGCRRVNEFLLVLIFQKLYFYRESAHLTFKILSEDKLTNFQITNLLTLFVSLM